MKIRNIAIVAVAAAFLAGCQNSDYGTKQTVGALGGAALGGLAGSQVGGGRGQLIATGVGAVAGAFLGSELGRSLDRADRMYAEQTAQRTFENNRSGQTSSWVNPDSGHSGTFTPTSTYQRDGQYCREFQQTIAVDGRVEEAHGTACRQADGSWRIVN